MPINKTITASSTVCAECKQKFSKVSNLRAHVTKKHPEKLDILCPKKVYQSVATCNECNKTFVNRCNLRTHLRNKHPDKVENVAIKKDYDCVLCNLHFNKMRDLLMHKKSHKVVKSYSCTFCQHNEMTKEKLLSHYIVIHGIKMETENNMFSSFEEFQSWKCTIEKETLSSFVNAHGSYKTKNYIRIQYNCHRSGCFKSRGSGMRHLKTQGSNKINGYCPANMDVIIKMSKCEITFLKTHVGHEHELQHLFLTESERQDLAAKIAGKIPLPVILDEVQDSVSNCKLERLHLLKKKDLYNIEQCFQLNSSSVCHAHDTVKTIDDDSHNLHMNINTDDNESDKIIESISEPQKRKTTVQFSEEKSKLIMELLQKGNSVQSLQEIDAIRRIIQPIEPTLDALRCRKRTTPSRLLDAPHNKKRTPQRCSFATKRTKTCRNY